MANIKSKKKRVKTNEKARQRNASTRSALKTHVKAADTAIAEKSDDTKAMISTAQSKLAKAAGKNSIHKNAAARKTSRLMKKASD